MPQFRKKPVVIDAIQNDGKWATVRDWLLGLTSNGELIFPVLTAPPITMNADGSLSIDTLEGVMRADVGDWVIKGIKGEYYPCKPDIFEATYELVGLDP